MPDPLLEFNKPVNIGTHASRIPVYIVSGILMTLLFLMLVKGNMRAKETVDEPKKIPVMESVRLEPNKEQWFDNDRVKVDIGIENRKAPQTEAEIVKKSEDDSVLKLKQLEVDQEYELKVEALKLRTKMRLEEIALEHTAAQSPLDIKLEEGRQPKGASAISLEGTEETSSSSTGIAMPSLPQSEDINHQDHKEAFLKEGVSSGEYLPNLKRKPLSPYEIKAGTYIPAAMITGISSDLPGNIVAQVTENVYDTATGQYLLVPQGAKLVGMYDSQVSFGQNRALVVWTRLIFPDGSSINLQRMQGVDIAGYAGFKDKIDNHYLRIYGNALLLSLVGAGYDLLNKPNESNNDNATQSVAANVGQKLADVSSESIKRNMNIQPTIMIRPGYKFKVMVMKDMVLEDM